MRPKKRTAQSAPITLGGQPQTTPTPEETTTPFGEPAAAPAIPLEAQQDATKPPTAQEKPAKKTTKKTSKRTSKRAKPRAAASPSVKRSIFDKPDFKQEEGKPRSPLSVRLSNEVWDAIEDHKQFVKERYDTVLTDSQLVRGALLAALNQLEQQRALGDDADLEVLDEIYPYMEVNHRE